MKAEDNKWILTVEPDDTGAEEHDPRKPGNSHLGSMVCFHRRYDLGDVEKHGLDPKNFAGWMKMEEYIRIHLKAAIVLPLFLYDHSGLRMKVGSFKGLLPQGHAEFDTAQVGFIFVTEETVKSEYVNQSLTWGEMKDMAEQALIREVEIYDTFLSEGAWKYTLEQKLPAKTCNKCGNRVNDLTEVAYACDGFIGSDPKANGMVDFLPMTARYLVDLLE